MRFYSSSLPLLLLANVAMANAMVKLPPVPDAAVIAKVVPPKPQHPVAPSPAISHLVPHQAIHVARNIAVICPEGEGINSMNRCKPCNAGFKSEKIGRADYCTICPGGSYSKDSSTTCTPCEKNSNTWAAPGSSSCTTCLTTGVQICSPTSSLAISCWSGWHLDTLVCIPDFPSMIAQPTPKIHSKPRST